MDRKKDKVAESYEVPSSLDEELTYSYSPANWQEGIL